MRLYLSLCFARNTLDLFQNFFIPFSFLPLFRRFFRYFICFWIFLARLAMFSVLHWILFALAALFNASTLALHAGAAIHFLSAFLVTLLTIFRLNRGILPFMHF